MFRILVNPLAIIGHVAPHNIRRTIRAQSNASPCIILHDFYDIQYHLVWVTKYRYQVLWGEIAERARDIIDKSV